MLKISIPTRMKFNKGIIISDINRIHNNYLKDIRSTTINIMRRESPSRSGAMRRSIKIIRQQITKSGFISKGVNIVIGPSVPYLKFVVKGTRQSKGRYVPRLGIRVSTGITKGITANPFIDRTARIVNAKLQQIGEKHYRRWNLSWSRALK